VSVAGIATLFGHHWRRYRVPLVPMAVGLALFQFMFTRMAPAPNEVSWMTRMMAMVPPELLAIAGSDMSGLTPGGFLGMGYGHPFILLMLSAWAVRVSSGALAGEIGRGTMDLLAARPVPRWQHVAAAYLAVGGGVALLAAAAWSGTVVGLQLRALGVSPLPILRIAVMAWLLFVTFGAIGLAIASTQREGGAAMGSLSGVIATSFVLEYLARIWKPMSAFRPFSLFTYYDPQRVVRAGWNRVDIAVLAGVTVVALATAVLLFRRRDL
jgi:ABC-2 type transport system permease protein